MKETLFVGKITATATHEIKNVLAIIRESSGLMQDFLNMLKDETFPYKDRFLKILSSIEDQVVRGDAISTLLNKFAHAPDNDSASENIPETIGQMIALTQRLAKVKEVSFLNEPAQDTILLTCEPLRTRMLIYQCMDVLMNHANRGEEICIRSMLNEDKKTQLNFCLQSNKTSNESLEHLQSSNEWKDISATSETINSKASFYPDSGMLTIVLGNLDVN